MFEYVPSSRTILSRLGGASGGCVKLCQLRLRRDSSACGRPLRRLLSCRSPRGAKQPYGVRPARPGRVSGRRRCLTSRPRNLSVPYAVSSKRRDRSPRGGTGADRDAGGNRDPVRSGYRSVRRIVPVRAWLGVRAACSNGSTHLRMSAPVHDAGANPKPTGSGLFTPKALQTHGPGSRSAPWGKWSTSLGRFGFAEPVGHSRNQFPRVRSLRSRPWAMLFNRYAVRRGPSRKGATAERKASGQAGKSFSKTV